MNATASLTEATGSSRRVTLAPNDAKRLCNNNNNNNNNNTDNNNNNNNKTTTKNTQEAAKQQQQQQQQQQKNSEQKNHLQFCWYWHQDQYWWPALYFDSTMEAQIHCAPSMKNAIMKRHVASLALQEALQQLKADYNNNNNNNNNSTQKKRHCPTVALVDQNDDYWIVQLNNNNADDDDDAASSSRKGVVVVERDVEEGDHNTTSFWDNLIVRFHETNECLQGNPALQARLQGAMQHLDKLNRMSLLSSSSSSSSCPTLSSSSSGSGSGSGSSNQQRQQQQSNDDDNEVNEAMPDYNHDTHHNAVNVSGVAATAVTASSSSPNPTPRSPVVAAAAAASLSNANDGSQQKQQQQPNPLVPTFNTKVSSHSNSNHRDLESTSSTAAAAAAAAARATRSNDDENDDIMVDNNNNDDSDDDDDKNQAATENDTTSNETSHNDKSVSSSFTAKPRRGGGGAGGEAAAGKKREEWIPPMEGDESLIQPDDAWETVEAKLEFSGWTKRRPATTNSNNSHYHAAAAAAAVALVNAFWWVKPGRPSGHGGGGILNQDYFDNLSLLQAFCRRAYGWQGGTAAAAVAAAPSPPPRPELRRQSSRRMGGGMTTPENRKTRPQHPGKPLLLDDDDDDDDDEETESFPIRNKHSKKLFDATAASNQEQEEEEEEEEDEAQSEEESQKRKPKKSTKKPKPKEQPTKKRKLVTAAPLPAGKKQKNSTSKKTTTGKAAASKKTTTTTTTADPHWWKTIPVPSSNDVWPILEQLKFSRVNGYYHLPGKDKLLAFCSLQGLRTFLCLYGIPGRCENDDAAAADALDSGDAETLERWIKFANVPVTKRNSVAELQNVSSPKSDAVLMQLLCDLGCSTLDSKLHLPISDLFRFQRRMNVHYFNLQNPESLKQARIAVRGQLWTFAKRNTVKVEQLLQVALWSATSSSRDLPVFVGLPETRNASNDPVHKYNKELLDKLADLPALVSNPEDEELVEQLEAEEAEEEETSSSLEESSTEPQSADEDEHEHSTEEEQDDEMSTDEGQDDEMSVEAGDDDASQDSSVVKVVKRPPKATANKGKESSKQAKTPKQPTAIVSQTTTKGKKQLQPATKTKQNKSKEPWWKTEPMPSGRSVRPFLARLGFTIEQRRYHLPADLYDAKRFGSIQALRLFLCQFGIPKINSSRLSQKEKTLLINWVKFASVPVDAKNSVDKLANVSPPTKNDIIVQLLCKHGWTSFDDRLYVPGHSHDAKSREKGFDFFDLDQLETHVRLLVRGKLWTYRYAERRQEQKHLQLALWAATAAGDLPTFTVMPDGDELQKFDIEETDVSESESDDMSMSTELRKAQPTSESDDVSMSTDSAVEAVGTLAKASVPKAKKEKKAKKDPRPFFMREPVPLLDQVWATLEILGFKRNGNAFSHPQLPGRTFSTEASLRTFLIKERIEGLAIKRDDLSQADQEKLDHWVKWTHVPGLTPQSSVHKMQDYKTPSKNAIHQWLGKIRVQSLNGEYHFPTSDKARQTRREGIHYVVGLDAVRVHIRERSKAELEKEDDLDLSAIDNKALFLLRSWAASSEAPLPIFSKPKLAAYSREARHRRASLHLESRKSGATTAPSTSTPDDVNDVGSAEVPLESNEQSAQRGMIMDTAALCASQQSEVDTQHQSPQQQRSSPATAAPSPSNSKQYAEVNHVFQLEDPVEIQQESLQQNEASIATSAPNSNPHHQSLDISASQPLPALDCAEMQGDGKKIAPLKSSGSSTVQEELDNETEKDESNMQDMTDDLATSSPVMLLTQPGGEEEEYDGEQEDDESSFRSLTSRFKDYSSNFVSSLFSASKASVQKAASASSPKSPGTARFNTNSNSKGNASAPATDAVQLDQIPVLMYNTLKNNKGSSAQAHTATETCQQENRTETSLENDNDTEEWNETNLFTQ